MGRAPCCEKVGLKKGRWTAEEDELLEKYIEANGEGSWRSLPKNAGLLRCGKSCRLRWINYLRADLKRGNISAEEENTIVKLHASFGNRWSLIASHLPGRTDNEIKNYWNSHLSRKIYSFPATGGSESSGITDTPKVVAIPPKRKCGRTSRWAMKKNKTYTQDNTITHNKAKQKSDSDVQFPPPPPTDAVKEVGEEVNKCDKKKSLNDVEESKEDDMLGLCDLEGINEGSGALGLETCGVWDLSEEREGVKMASSSEGSSVICGMDFDLDQEWNWESVIEFNNVAVDSSEACNNLEQQKLLAWLWEDDDWENQSKRLEETDTQTQNDIIDWFLS